MTRPSGLTIFDDIKRTDSSPARDTEDSFHFLNRVAREPWQRVRELTDSWFADYPAAAKLDLRSRFREADASQHYGARWELYVYTLHRRLGYEVVIHPTLPNSTRQPDFLVTRGDTSEYVECAVHLSTTGANSKGGERSWIFEATNQARDPNFMVDIDIRRSGSQRPKASEIIEPLERWLSSLDPDAVSDEIARCHRSPELLLEIRGWTIDYGAWPVKPDRRGEPSRLIAMYPAIDGWISNEMLRFRDILGKKGRHYGKPDKPLTVAILNTSGFADAEDVTEALFGTKETRHVPGQPGSIHNIRRRDGYWRQGPPKRGSRVSAVLVGQNIYPWRITAGLPTVWVIPWADLPTSAEAPMLTNTAHDDGQVYEVHSGTSPDQVFALGADWPGFSN